MLRLFDLELLLLLAETLPVPLADGRLETGRIELAAVPVDRTLRDRLLADLLAVPDEIETPGESVTVTV